MKKIVIAVAAGGVAFTLHRLARKARALHDHCRATMRDRCGASIAGCA